MPHPSLLDRDTLLQRAYDMIESEGVAKFSLHKLAAKFDVKTPSLYRYFKNKDALLREVNTLTSKRMFAEMQQHMADSSNPIEQLTKIAMAYRAYALANPKLYTLLYASFDDNLRPEESHLLSVALVWQERLAQLIGDERSLTALRGMWAIMHGFSMLEMANQMQRGGDLQATYEEAIRIYLRGCEV